MAQRDYVRKKKKPQQKNNSRIIPNLMMAFAVILIILFIAILYFISTTNKPNKPALPPEKVTQSPAETLPEKPQERWTYLKALENPQNELQTGATSGSSPLSSQAQTQAQQDKEKQQILQQFISGTNSRQTENVQKPAHPTSSQTSQWIIQCGAFKDKSNAESLKAKLAIVGVSSSIKKTNKFYRVIAGQHDTKKSAEKVINTLKNSGISSCITSK